MSKKSELDKLLDKVPTIENLNRIIEILSEKESLTEDEEYHLMFAKYCLQEFSKDKKDIIESGKIDKDTEHKILVIVKRRRVNIAGLVHEPSFESYDMYYNHGRPHEFWLTKEEFDFIKPYFG